MSDHRDLALEALAADAATLRREHDDAIDRAETYRALACEALAALHLLTTKLQTETTRRRDQDRQLRDVFGTSTRREAA